MTYNLISGNLRVFIFYLCSLDVVHHHLSALVGSHHTTVGIVLTIVLTQSSFLSEPGTGLTINWFLYFNGYDENRWILDSGHEFVADNGSSF